MKTVDHILLDLVLKSEIVRGMQRTGRHEPAASLMCPDKDVSPYRRMLRDLRAAVGDLALRCRAEGRDIRTSPYWARLEYRHVYVDCFHYGRFQPTDAVPTHARSQS